MTATTVLTNIKGSISLLGKIQSIIHSNLDPIQKENELKSLIPLWTKEELEQAVCSHFNIHPDQLRSKTKIPRIVKARHIVRFLTNEIKAGEYGNRSNYYQSVKLIKGCIEVGDPIVADIEAIRNKLVS
jgi:hypothetical protein